MFDSSEPFELPMRPASAGGAETTISMRWPTDAEWVARNRTHKILVRHPGRGVSENVPSEPNEADVKLYEAIKLNGAPPLTATEAQLVLDALGRCNVTDVSIEGTETTVEMSISTGMATHKLKVPTADQVARMQRASSRILTLPYGTQEYKINPEPAAQLYDELGGHSDDYQGAVPLIHKDEVIRSVILFIDRTLEPKTRGANF